MTNMIVQSSSDTLFHAVADLDANEFERFVTRVLALQAQRRAQSMSDREAELLKQVNLGVAPAIWWRYETLKAKRRAMTLTEPEHAELIAIGDQIERANARRIAALIQLADLRQIPLETLMDQMGLRSPGVE